MDISKYLYSLEWLNKEPSIVKFLLPNLENNPKVHFDTRQIDPKAIYYYYPMYYGNDEYFNESNTYIGQYQMEAQHRVDYERTDIIRTSASKEPDSTTYKYQYDGYGPYGNKLTETQAYTAKNYDFEDTNANLYYEWHDGFLWIPANGHHDVYELGKRVKVEKFTYTGLYRWTTYGSYNTYPHAEKLIFNYKSFNQLIWVAPTGHISLILDYFGKQKMILEYTEGNAVDANGNTLQLKFYISQEVHYSRNYYNRPKGNDNVIYPLYEMLYPTKGDLLNSSVGWEEALVTGTYFHRLHGITGGTNPNANNVKYTKKQEYYDSILHHLTFGSAELVYNGSSNLSTLVTDSLVKFTFNFGEKASYGQNESIVDAHWIRDVYPYLIWGNDSNDYDAHTPFERFCWDKDSGDSIPTAHNQAGTTLTNRYKASPGGLQDMGGTEIPSYFQSTERGIRDKTSPTFSVSTRTITTSTSNVNWAQTIYMNNLSDNMSGTITIIEVSDNVVYGVPGTYSVTVSATDSSENSLQKTFSVIVSSSGGSGGGSSGGGGSGGGGKYIVEN
jgi:hypothetical protein